MPQHGPPYKKDPLLLDIECLWCILIETIFSEPTEIGVKGE